MHDFRWWLFKKFSAVGWLICPEPDRTNLRVLFGVRWDEVKGEVDQIARDQQSKNPA